jgi:hypothetical protein
MFAAIGNLTSQEWPEIKLLPNAELFFAARLFLQNFSELWGNLIPNSAGVLLILKLPKLNPHNQLSLNKALNFE